MKYFFYFLLTTPWFYWLYLSFTGGLGVEPLETLSVHSGFVTISLLLFNLWLGVGIRFLKGKISLLRWFYQRRRSLGVATGIYALLHFNIYLAQEGFAYQGFEQLWTKTYLTVAFIALVILTTLLLTSNNFSVRLLKPNRWKQVHRLVHVASLLILTHVLLIEKSNIPLLLVMTMPLVPFQLWRLASFLKAYKK
jgi:sulfoxide reductase heme-binding subunit YedZ